MEQNKNISIYNSVFRIGIVHSVDGRVVKVLVDKDKNNSHLIFQGQLIKNVAVGSYVKVLKGFETIIGKVESEYIETDKSVPVQYSSQEEYINRFLIVKLIGHIEGSSYKKGLTELPLIANECHLLTNEEFKMIHSFGSKDDMFIKIGAIASDPLVPISVGINKLFASHIGIFGNTGSGKSYTLAKIYRQLFLTFKNNESFKTNAKFLFYDFNGEYSKENAIIEGKKIYDLSTGTEEGKDKIPLSEEDMLDENLLCIFASATEKTQRPFIVRCIKLYNLIGGDVEKFKNYLRQQIYSILQMSDKVKGDLLIDYVEQILPLNIKNGIDIGLRDDFSYHSSSQCYYLKDRSRGFFNFQDRPQIILNLKIYKQVDMFTFSDNFITNFINIMYMRLIYDMLGNRAMNEHIAPAINKLKSNEKNIEKVFDFTGKIGSFWSNSNIAVINLCNVNTDMKKLIPLLLTNKLYRNYKKNRNGNDYLNIIVDEAHNILSYQSTRESESWKDYRLEVFEEIIKEGRKFGVFMTIASQRPSDISSTIISQLHNYFIHRLMNEKDIQQVNNTISYLDKVSVESLPILSTGVCVLAGQLAEMPIVIQIDRIEDKNKPQNETINLIEAWGK